MYATETASTPAAPWLDDRNRNTMIAALRYYQMHGLADDPEKRPESTRDIVSDGGTDEGLDDQEIDELCENLNFADAPTGTNQDQYGQDKYPAVAICLWHLPEPDFQKLHKLAANGDRGILARDSGFILKLQQKAEDNRRPELSDEFNHIVMSLHQAGYLLIELDDMADAVEAFPLFDRW